MNRRTILAALALVAMAGCQKESAADLAATSAAVQFSSESLAMRTETLNGADAWSPGDAVGIFTDGFAVERANVEYTADIVAASATTSFKVANSGEEILYPNFNDVDVTFSAYYPYQAAATASDITIDISGQKDDLGSVDFMCGSFSWLKASDNHDTAVAFTFGHKLAKVILNITAGDTMA
ncbi:MAG: fimbrillin family protein, partial [Rikenellaceae bacterium]